MESNEGIHICPICETSNNSRGEPLVSDHAIACHIAGKCKTGDRIHRSWALTKSPAVNFKATIPQIAELIEWAVAEAQQERLQNALKDQRIRTPFEKITSIEKIVHNFIENTLRSEFGNSEQEWWVKGIPLAIREQCQKMCENGNRRQPPYSYTYLIDLKEILSKNWNIFETNYQHISRQCKSKKEFLEAFNKLNEIRNMVFHPTRKEEENLSEEEEQFLDWFDKVTKEFISTK